MREGLRRSPRKSPNRSPRLGSPRGARGAHHDEDALPATPQRSKRAKRLFELID